MNVLSVCESRVVSVVVNSQLDAAPAAPLMLSQSASECDFSWFHSYSSSTFGSLIAVADTRTGFSHR